VAALNGTLKLYSYRRSSAAYRARIALNPKALDYEIESVHLVQDGGQQHSADYQRVNPQGLVPVLRHGQRLIRQSMAIMEYIDETWPTHPLLPATARDRARVRALGQIIACDSHPLNNLRVQQYLEHELKVSGPKREAWTRHWLQLGFEALESLLADNPATGEFCDGEEPGFADCCLIPQVYNARRFGVDLTPFPNVVRIDAACEVLPEFQAAHPDNQLDAPAAD
jgi:maleylacetoacetate isomerase